MKNNLLLCFVLLTSFGQAQTLKIEFTNSQGEAVPFATITDKQTNKSWVADADGIYYHKLYSTADTLEIQSLGFVRKQFIVKEGMKAPLKVTMTSSYNELTSVEVQGAASHVFGFSKETISASSMLLDEKALSKLETNDIHQVLLAVPGVQIQQEDGFGLRPNIGMRGTGVERSSKITLMEDGVLIAPAPYAASAAYYFPSMDHVESVEVLKGSSQIAYGPQTNGGAINLISDRIPDGFEGKARVSLGSFLTRKVQGSVGGSEENFGYLLKGTYFGSNGFKDLPNGENTGFGRSDVLAKLRFNTSDDAKHYQAFTVKFGYTQENTNETYLGLTLDDFNADPTRRYAASELDNIQSKHTQIQLNHLIQPAKNLTISSTIYLNKFSRNWFKLDKVSANGTDYVGISGVLSSPEENEAEIDLIRGDDFTSVNRLDLKNNNRGYTSKGVQTNINYELKTGEVKHRFALGLRLHADEMDRFQWKDKYTMTAEGLDLISEGTPGTESNRIESARAFAAFLQYSIQYKKFTLNPGFRFETMKISKDDYGKVDTERLGTDLKLTSNTSSVILPGASLNYKVKGRNHLFIGAHKGFSPANSNPETKPEESWNFEAGSKGIAKGFAYEIIGFANRYSNLLGSDLNAVGGTGGTELFNGGKVNVYGLEAMLSYNVLRKYSSDLRMPISFSYTYTNARFQSEFESAGPWGDVMKGDFLPYVANHQLFTQLGIEQKHFDINLTAKLVGAMRTSPGQGDFQEESATPLFYQLDLLARYKMNKYFGMYVKWNNLSNNIQRVAQQPAGWRPNMPMYVEGGVDVTF